MQHLCMPGRNIYKVCMLINHSLTLTQRLHGVRIATYTHTVKAHRQCIVRAYTHKPSWHIQCTDFVLTACVVVRRKPVGCACAMYEWYENNNIQQLSNIIYRGSKPLMGLTVAYLFG